jgi:hypothetical protein
MLDAVEFTTYFRKAFPTKTKLGIIFPAKPNKKLKEFFQAFNIRRLAMNQHNYLLKSNLLILLFRLYPRRTSAMLFFRRKIMATKHSDFYGGIHDLFKRISAE